MFGPLSRSFRIRIAGRARVHPSVTKFACRDRPTHPTFLHSQVGWRKPRAIKANHSIVLLFNFDALRNFSRMTIHANNYYPKHIYVFRSVTIEFLNEHGTVENASTITHQNPHDDQFEMARAIMINLKNHIASQLKLRLHFDGHWILISEITFDSFIVPVPPPTTTTTTTESVVRVDKDEPRLLDKYASHNRWIYIIVCVATMAIVFMLATILILIRRTLMDHKQIKKHYFTPIHNHTHSSASTTSSDIDFGSSQHRYATIGPAHPYLLCTSGGSMGSSSSPHYAKLMPTNVTTTLLRTPALIQQNHVEGICGNSAYGTQRLFTFDLNQHQFVPMNQITIKRILECRKQVVGGGEVTCFSSSRTTPDPSRASVLAAVRVQCGPRTARSSRGERKGDGVSRRRTAVELITCVLFKERTSNVLRERSEVLLV